MAIAFARASIHSRSKGHSAVAAAAYRSGMRLTDDRTGIVYDFSHRHDVVYSELLLPEFSPTQFNDRQLLWNQVELAEKRVDSQVCKDIVLALPKELSLVEQIELAKRFAQTHFVDNGIPADVAIHDHGDGNPHAHILVSTRRLENSGFAKYKARDLNPAFARGFIVEDELWGQRWRDMQNGFFNEHNIDLSVDLNHVISERHQGNNRDSVSHYLQEENKLIREAREEIALLHVDNLINQISLTNSVFTRREIERLLFKTMTDKDNQTHFLSYVEQVLSHKDVIKLGVNDRGIESYTTRHHYIQEAKLLDNVSTLQGRKNHVYKEETDALSKKYNLDTQQSEALSFITQGEDISVLVGRPGAGKSYLLKPLKDYYQANGCEVLGAALSGKVAKALETDTGIKSSTIASLTYRLSKHQLQLTKDHILVIDEAGMVDFSNMAYLLNEVTKAEAKIILVGDSDQLKPIYKGEIFRGITARTGYIELDNIRRQTDEGDRRASLDLAKGRIADAIQYYDSKGAINFAETSSDAITKMVQSWSENLNSDTIKDHIMLSFTRAAVSSLNAEARVAMQDKGLVGKDNFDYFSENGAASIALAKGERILLRQNDKTIGVRNGDLATITSINKNQFAATLDSGAKITIPITYRFIEYGYALTVHKAQGMTVDHTSVLIDSTYWDRALSFVAMTRHRLSLTLYADKHQHPNLDRLTKTLERQSTRDNVIDWPLDYAIRCGFEPDGLIGRAINHIAGMANQIKEKWNYLVHYETYLKNADVQAKVSDRQLLRSTAKNIADYLDKKYATTKQLINIEKEAKQKGVDKSSLPAFEDFYANSLSRDKLAWDIMHTKAEQIEKNINKTHVLESLAQHSSRYERYQSIIAVAEAPLEAHISKKLTKQTSKIDLEKDYIHIIKLSGQYNKTPRALYQQIETLQKTHHQMEFDKLKKEYPVIAQYTQIFNERNEASGFRKKELDNELLIKAKEIKGNKILGDRLQRNFPKFAIALTRGNKDHAK